MHLLLYGIILGWGAAIPVGPVCLEMTRRNLSYGTGYGITLGLGACLADLTYLILLCTGAILLLQHPLALKLVGIIGSLILAWFGIMTLCKRDTIEKLITHNKTYLRNTAEGYLITLFNPYTILFWISVSSQILLMSTTSSSATIYAGIGVLLGTISWVLLFNCLIHKTRHRLSTKMIHIFNMTGATILLAFAIFGLIKIFY